MSDDDFAFEPQRGLPAALPQGERVLWQGAPDWYRLAVTAFHIRKVAVYFVALAAWQAAVDGQPALGSIGWTAMLAVAAIAILCGLAYAYARSTVYTLTTARVVIRSGLTVPVTMNLPLTLVDAASVRRHGGTSGSIALTLTRGERAAYFVLWPNVRPLTFNRPEPMLRALADLDEVTPLLADALKRTGAGVAVESPRIARLPAGVVAAADPAG